MQRDGGFAAASAALNDDDTALRLAYQIELVAIDKRGNFRQMFVVATDECGFGTRFVFGGFGRFFFFLNRRRFGRACRQTLPALQRRQCQRFVFPPDIIGVTEKNALRTAYAT